MGDPMMKMGAGGPPQGMPPGGGSSPVMKNMSALNPTDAAMMGSSGQFTPDMTVADYFQKLGIDVNGPVTQLVDFAKKQQENANPINKMRNIAADTALQKGGQPPTMPGVKPMVAPPGQPSPSGLQGLMSKLGG
jgi:hypothetical protein